MDKVYLLPDSHLKHNEVKTYCKRLDNFTEIVHRNVMNTVKPEDILIHLGDVGIDKAEGPQGFMKYVREWPGKKWLVRGNHDGKSPLWYVKHGFDFCADAILFRGVWLTHRPWREALPHGAVLNVHGHLHNVWDGFESEDPEKENDEFFSAFKSGHLQFPWQRLCALEYIDYRPVEFDKFVAKGHRLYQSTGPNEETKRRNLENKFKTFPTLSEVATSIPDATGDSNG